MACMRGLKSSLWITYVLTDYYTPLAFHAQENLAFLCVLSLKVIGLMGVGGLLSFHAQENLAFLCVLSLKVIGLMGVGGRDCISEDTLFQMVYF